MTVKAPVGGESDYRGAGSFPRFNELLTLLAAQPSGARKIVLLGIAAFAIVCIGAASQYTDHRVSTSFLYLLPVLLVAWSWGLRMGLLTAAIASAVWYATELRTMDEFGGPTIPSWNALMRLGTFSVAALLVAAMNSLNRRLEDRVKERTAALEAQLAENNTLEQAIIDISEQERSRIGQDIHDGLCQQLIGVAFGLSMLRKSMESQDSSAAEELSGLQRHVDKAIGDAHQLATELFPPGLEAEGLLVALEELASRVGEMFAIKCEVEACSRTPEALPQAALGALYRIAQEAVLNAARHSGGSLIRIGLKGSGSVLRLTVLDDGCGVSEREGARAGMGLRIMAYRARMIGATIEFGSGCNGRGVGITCEVPVRNSQTR
jgi:signal transduction histidine kinase